MKKLTWLLLCIPLLAMAREIRSIHHFTMTLPNHWEEIPPRALDDYSKSSHNLSGEIPRRNYAYAFQPRGQEPYFSFPYVLVQVELGRLAEGTVKMYKSLPHDRSDLVSEQTRGLITGVEVGTVLYDSDQQILWSTMLLTAPGVGELWVLIGVVLTEESSIRVTGYCRATDKGRMEGVFREMIQGIKIDEQIRYKPRKVIPFPPLTGTINRNGLVMSLMAIGMFMLWVSCRRRMWKRRSADRRQ